MSVLEMGHAVQEERREFGAKLAVVVLEHVPLELVEDRDPLPPVESGALAQELPSDRQHRRGREPVSDHEAQEVGVVAQAERHVRVRVLLDVLAHEAEEGLEFGRLGTTPRSESPAALGDRSVLLETGEVKRTLTLYAPASGVVTRLGVRAGMEVKPNSNLYTIADLSRVWVLANVYEFELPWLD